MNVTTYSRWWDLSGHFACLTCDIFSGSRLLEETKDIEHIVALYLVLALLP